MKSNSKISSIIHLRAAAALAVCFVHIQMACDLHVNFLIDYLLNNGQLGVAIFFVISGFILPYSLYKKGYKLNGFFNFLLRRSIRIDPPYWFAIALLFIVGIVPLHLLTIKILLLHFFYLIPFVKAENWYTGIFWTLSIEFQFYLLLGLFFPFFMRIKTSAAMLILIAVGVLCVLTRFTAPGIIINNMYDFIIGLIAFLIYIGKISFKRGLLILIVFSCYIMFAVSIKSGALPLITALIILFNKSEKRIQPLYFIGQISYSLYLIHGTATYLFVKLLGQYIPNTVLLFIASLIISIVTAYFFYHIIEVNAIKLSKKVLLKKKLVVKD